MSIEDGSESGPQNVSGQAPLRVLVVGAGTMAPGIAAAFLAKGAHVQIWGRTPGSAARAVTTAGEMVAFLRTHELASASAGGTVSAAGSVSAAAEAHVVVEAISEDLEAKRELIRRLESASSPDTLLATNTSGLKVSDVAEGMRAPERLVAMHFWNPAHLMPIVEICGGRATAPMAVERAVELARHIGKVPVVLKKEVLGLLGTRMQQAVVREAIGLLAAGVASPEAIDLAVRASFGIRFPAIGPLETTDLSGLDVILSIHRYLLPDLDSSTEPQEELSRRVAAGLVGVKSGAGFYDWSQRDAGAVVRRRDEELVRRLKLVSADPTFFELTAADRKES